MNRTVTREDLRKRVVANRAGQHFGTGTIHATGHFDCSLCGGYVVNIAECARLIGVGAQTLSKWLNRQPIRPDIAATIRASFLRVEE